MSDLTVEGCLMPDHHREHLARYINQYCGETLSKIEFRYNWVFRKDVFQKPFERVETVRLYEAHLENNLMNFVNWFPNFRRLHLYQFVFF